MRYIFLILFLSFSFFTHAQNEGNIWYFGYNAGLDFNLGAPVALNDGVLSTLEGCATISDASGDLLFYTDGSKVYNSNHTLMPNGTGLHGDSSSTQSAIIIKKPGTTNIYTIFTVDAFGHPHGLQYSEVDMTLNGGLGDIVPMVKNIPVYAPTCEKITAIKHSNGIDYWIIIHEIGSPSNPSVNFRAYLFNSSGLTTTPVTSPGDNIPNSLHVFSYLKANISGTKIAYTQQFSPIPGGSPYVKVYDFDNTTGIISNEIHIPTPFGVYGPYGLEFSPNSQYLYVSAASGPLPIYQYDLLAGSATDIKNSETNIGIIGQGGAMQLGPDQKIYIAALWQNNLGTISSPNLAGTLCDFDPNGMPLAPGTTSSYGLPTFFNNIADLNPYTLIVHNLCQGDSIKLFYTEFSDYHWSLLNDTTILSIDPTLTVSPSNDTSYLLFNSTDTIQFNINVKPLITLNLGPNNCTAQDSVILDVTQTDPDVTYLWQDGSNNPILTVYNTGVYWVEVSNGPCTERDSIFIQFESLLIDGDEFILCDSIVNLNVTDSNPNTGTWEYLPSLGGPQTVIFDPNENSINPTIIVPELGEYIFTYTSECGFTDTHTVVFENLPPELDIAVNQQCDFEIELEASTHQNGYWTALGPEGDTVIINDTNAPHTFATVSNYGEYTFTYTYDFCNASSSTSIDVQSIKPTITNTQDIYSCNKTIQLNAVIPGQEGNWSAEGTGAISFTNAQDLNTEASVSEYGNYTFYYTGCNQTDTFDVIFNKAAPIIHAPIYVKCSTETLIEVQYSGNEIGTWSFESETNNNIDVSKLNNNTISLSTDIYGEIDLTYSTCDTFTTVKIVFMCELDIPNIFTPNGDETNNEFTIQRLNSTYYDRSVFTVYNRWGIEVYANKQYGLDGLWWDGKASKNGEDLTEGIYYYVLHLHNKVSDSDEIYKGSIHIFR